MHHYKVSLNWQNGRIGLLSSSDLTEKINVATPPEFDQGVAGIWSPEHLFTAAVQSCYMTTFLAIAANSGLSFSAFSCDATGILDKEAGKFKMTRVILKPRLQLTDNNHHEKSLRILEKAEQHCLITNSINCQVILELEEAVTA